MAIHWQSLDLTESTPVKARITITAVIHVGNKTPVILRFYAEITVAAAKIAAAFRSSDNAI